MKKLFFIFVSFLFIQDLYAQEGFSVVAVGEATLDKEKLVVQEPYFSGAVSASQKAMATEMTKLMKNDFAFYLKRFYVQEAAPNNTASRPSTNWEYWNGKGIRYLIGITVEKSSDGAKFNFVADDVKERKQIFKQQVSATSSNLRRKGHEIANGIYKVITGKESIFKSKIIFVSDRNSRPGKTVKEVYLMDFDGKGVKQLTSHGGITISPAMSPDGRYVVYSLIPGETSMRRNISLYLLDLQTNVSTVLSSKEGINSGAVFSADGKSIYLTLSMSGNAEIYEMNVESRELRKVTNHFSSDVDPSINVSGTLMTFLSDRPGKAMIYTMDPNGTEKEVKRISYVGQFNATPRFSPDGKEIVFSSWLDNCFDLFRISSDGTGLSRLTKDFGSNEDPTYSNDGQFISFSSQRVISRVKAEQNIYIMDRDGEILGAVTNNFGNCTTPRWYNFP